MGSELITIAPAASAGSEGAYVKRYASARFCLHILSRPHAFMVPEPRNRIAISAHMVVSNSISRK